VLHIGRVKAHRLVIASQLYSKRLPNKQLSGLGYTYD
jgi:hypothetical protein